MIYDVKGPIASRCHRSKQTKRALHYGIVRRFRLTRNMGEALVVSFSENDIKEAILPEKVVQKDTKGGLKY